MPILETRASIPSGHFSDDVIVKAIIRVGLWWTKLFQDATMFVKKFYVY